MLYSHINIFTDNNYIVHLHSTCLYGKFTASYKNISIFFFLIYSDNFYPLGQTCNTDYPLLIQFLCLYSAYILWIKHWYFFTISSSVRHTLLSHAEPLQMSYLFLAVVLYNRVYKKRIQFIIRCHILFMRHCCDAVNNGTRPNTSAHSCENIYI